MRIVVGGGPQFVSAALCRHLVCDRRAIVLEIAEHASSAGGRETAAIAGSPRYSLRRTDLADRSRLAALLEAFDPGAVIDLTGCEAVRQPRQALLEAARDFRDGLPDRHRDGFRVLAVASDARHAPTDPAAITASVPRCFGPWQPPDALVPDMILSTAAGRPRLDAAEAGPEVCGSWLHVSDLASALASIVERGCPGRTYAVPGSGECSPAALAALISAEVARLQPGAGWRQRMLAAQDLEPEIAPADRDETGALARELGWRPALGLAAAIRSTVRWYLANEHWWRAIEEARTVSSCAAPLMTHRVA